MKLTLVAALLLVAGPALAKETLNSSSAHELEQSRGTRGRSVRAADR